MRVVTEFKHRYIFLSNFFVEPDGTHVEGEYQAHKINPPVEGLLQSSTPAQAKAIGRTYDQTGRTRKDWYSINLKIMKMLVTRKFQDHPYLLLALGDTESFYLEEGNWWGDQFWGVCNGVGQNHLGLILMEVRTELCIPKFQ